MAQIRTHEAYVQAIYKIVMRSKALLPADRELLKQVKLTYGDKTPGTYGVTHFGSWHPHACCGGGKKKKALNGAAHPLITIGVLPGETTLELCDTVIHELGHVLAGLRAGHQKAWADACIKLGMLNPKAAGVSEGWQNFAAPLRKALKALPPPTDGAPVRPQVKVDADGVTIVGVADPGPRPVRTCGAGYGSRGGKSRGSGAGSRQLLWECGCDKPVKIRHAGRDLQAKCLMCNEKFALVEASIPPAQQQ